MELPNEIEWNIVKYMSHPIADLFKNELEEELEDHYRILKEGPGNEPNWCEDDDELFAYRFLCRKLHENGLDLQSWHLYNRGIYMRR